MSNSTFFAKNPGEIIIQAVEPIPEICYGGFSTYTLLIPELLKEVGHFILPQSSLVGFAWNYIDAACAAINGIKDLADSTTHRPIVTKLKGGISILNAGQLGVLTAISFPIFGGFAFAAAFGTGFFLSLDETTRAIRRFYDFEYWLKDSITLHRKLNDLQNDLQSEISKLGSCQVKGSMARWIIQRKSERLEQYKTQKEGLEKDILDRIKVKVALDIKFAKNAQLHKELDKAENNLKNNIHAILPLHESYNIALQDLEELKKNEAGIIEKDKTAIRDALMNSVMCGLAFTGMLLNCFPPTVPVGLCLIGVASLLFFAKNAIKLSLWVTLHKNNPSNETLFRRV